MLLEPREAHPGSVAVCDTELASYQSPIDLSRLHQQARRGYCRAMGRRYLYRFQIQLLYDGIEELGRGAIRGHKLISS